MLSFVFTVNSEVARVKYTLSHLTRYKENNYRIKLPKGITAESSPENILTAVREEFALAWFESQISSIRARNATYVEVNKILKSHFPKTTSSNYDVQLTKYGVGGSYHLPNKIVLGLPRKYPWKTVVHEMVHLSIEPFIQEFKIPHWVKERIVDVYLNRICPEYNRWQNNYNGVEGRADPLLRKYPHPSEQFFIEIANEFS